jgi:hypothetical protein
MASQLMMMVVFFSASRPHRLARLSVALRKSQVRQNLTFHFKKKLEGLAFLSYFEVVAGCRSITIDRRSSRRISRSSRGMLQKGH